MRHELLYIDLFCGAGGTSTGVERAYVNNEKCARVIACVNHDPNAIASHAANHPNALHYTEDIRTLDLTDLTALVCRERAKNPDAYIVLWASLECTNFSRAKGGKARDADSRTLAEHLFRYIEALDVDYIYIENVEEFMCWGDLDVHGKPVSKDEGRLYMKWVNKVKSYGYDFQHRLLNSANYGAYTSRTRFFGIFAKSNLPIVFPVPTHCKCGSKGMFGNLSKWKPVKEVLNLDEEGESIFTRRKPLVEKTLERIYAGLIKFVAGGNAAFLVKWNSMNKNGKYVAPGVDEPCPVVTVQNRLGVAKVNYLTSYYGNGGNSSVESPAPTITTVDRFGNVSVKFMTEYYGGADHNHSLDIPASTLTTRPRHAIIDTQFLDLQYGNGTPSSIDEPAPTVTTTPKHKLVSVKPWIMSTNFNNVGSSIDEPSQTVTANRKWQYLMNPQFASKGGDIDNPCFTLIARMDKMPPYLVSTEKGEVAIIIYEDDTPAMRRIKEFMALYGIVDIKMRMLNVTELKRIMGFGSDYTLIGTRAEQKKFIGNAVEVNMSMHLCKALYQKLNYNTKAERV